MNSLSNKMLSSIKNKLDYNKHNSNNNLSFETFKDHWKNVLMIFNKTLVDDKDIVQVKFNLEQIINILLNELNNLVNISLRLMSTTPNEASTESSTTVNESIELQDPSEVLNAYYGPIWEFLIKNNIFEVIFLWSLSYPEYLYDLKYEQLNYYENLLNHLHLNEQTNLLLFRQLHRPLFSLLNHCATHNSELIEGKMIEILNQLCVDICKNSNLLNIFFEHQQQEQEKLEHEEQLLLGKKNGLNCSGQASTPNRRTKGNNKDSNSNKNTSTPTLVNNESRRTNATSKFFIFSLLIPYIHKEGSLGQQARDALLMIMQLSSRNVSLAKYIVECTDFCPILATGLSGLYSELPQKLTPEQNVYEIRYLYKEDIMYITSLNKFINSLEFCNNVIQVSHSLIANKLLQFVYYGFLVPVIAPALTQNSDNLEILSDSTVKQNKYIVNCVEEIIAATTYLDLFLRTINEPNLLKIFLKFILYSKFDERITLLDTLINRINTNSKLCIVTLMLFYTMIDLNSEDVMYKLILSYLIPCKHLENQSEILNMNNSHLYESGANTEAFLSLSTDFSNFNGISKIENGNRKTLLSANLNESSIIYKWLSLSFEKNELNGIISYLDSIRFNFVDYLKDAKNGILQTIRNSSKWSSSYELDTYKLMNDLHSSKSICTESIIKENDSQSYPYAKRPAQELDNDPEEFLLNLDLFSNSFNEVPAKSNRSTLNLFSKENFDESESVDEYEDEDFDDDDDEAASQDKVSINSKSNKIKSLSSKKTKTIGEVQTTTEDIFNGSILSNKVDTNKDQALANKKNVSSKSNSKSVKKKVLSPEEMLKRDQKRERRQKRRDRAAANDFYVLSFDNELTETSSSESETDSSSKNENEQISTNATDDEEGDLTATSVSSTTTLNNEFNSLKANNLQTLIQSHSNEECRQKLVEYLFTNKEKTKQYLESNLNDFLGALDNFFQLNEANIKSETKTNNDINILCDQIVNIYNDIFVMNQNSTNLENDNLNKSEKNNLEIETNADMNKIKNSLKLTVFPNYVNESKQLDGSTSSLGDDNNGNNLTSNKSLVNNSTESSSSLSVSKETDIGPFLCAIFNRLEHMLSNSLQVNFLVTGLLARLAYYPQILLRSFLLNHNLLTIQPNMKSLFQAIGNVKFKIDHCSKTYEDFSLLYLKAKLFLVKRLIDSKISLADSSKLNNQSLSTNQPQHTPSLTPPSKKKSSKMDKFLSLFFKPLIETNPNENKNQVHQENGEEQESSVKSTNHSLISYTSNSHDQVYGLHENRTNQVFSNGLLTPQVELDLNDIKTKFSKPVESFQLKQFANDSYDFFIIENEWEDFNTRNIAFSVVIYDEFIKELAAICQEHSVTAQNL